MSIFHFFKKKSEPFLINDALGTFKRQKKTNFYHGSIKWIDEDVYVSLHCDSVDSLTANIALENLRKITVKAEEWDKKIKKYIADDLSDQNGMVEIWGDDMDTDNDISQITKKEFLSRISIGFIHLYPNGEIFFDYNMDGMFTDHGMGVYANISGEISSCELWG